jgi:hypothetical protein
MEAIEQAARDAALVNPENPLLPLPKIVRVRDANALRCLGYGIVGNQSRPLID